MVSDVAAPPAAPANPAARARCPLPDEAASEKHEHGHADHVPAHAREPHGVEAASHVRVAVVPAENMLCRVTRVTSRADSRLASALHERGGKTGHQRVRGRCARALTGPCACGTAPSTRTRPRPIPRPAPAPGSAEESCHTCRGPLPRAACWVTVPCAPRPPRRGPTTYRVGSPNAKSSTCFMAIRRTSPPVRFRARRSVRERPPAVSAVHVPTSMPHRHMIRCGKVVNDAALVGNAHVADKGQNPSVWCAVAKRIAAHVGSAAPPCVWARKESQ